MSGVHINSLTKGVRGMSFYRMQRGWCDKSVFEREPYCRRAAWIWLIEHAAFAPHNRLDRGQIRVSYRFLAKAWNWSEPKVRRWIAAAEKAEMIRCVTDAGKSLITICNYNKYQLPIHVADAPSDTQPTQTRRVADANYKEGKNEEESFPNGNRQSAKQIAAAMVEVWRLSAVPVGLPAVRKLTDSRIVAARKRFVEDFDSNIERWRDYVCRIVSCPFLIGDNERQFKVDFGWVLKPDNMVKIMEGKYDRKPNGCTTDRDISFYVGPTEPAPTLEELRISMERAH
jgi:hypothetical protein